MAASKSRTKHSAPGAYLGFTLQDVRLCFHLLGAPAGSAVSIEHLDDIAVHYPGGEILYEQDKSATVGNPLSDSSPELWKTLANWAEYCTTPILGGAQCRYQLYVAPAKSGKLASKIDAAASEADAEEIIKWAVKRVSSGKGDALKEQLARFQMIPKERQFHVLCNARIISVDNDPLNPLRGLFGVGLAPAVIEICCKYMIGSAQTQARAKLLAKVVPLIDADSFKLEAQRLVRNTNMQRLLPSAAKPIASKVSQILSAKPAFVRQLELIDIRHDGCLRAIADYLQASASKTDWAGAGLITQDTLDAWDEVLNSKHGAIRDELAETHADNAPDSRGRVLLARCKQVKEKLETYDVGHVFIHGSFHDLANRGVLGWHDAHKELLSEFE